MAFLDDETSRANGAPLELYKFVGTYNTYRMTSHDVEITVSDGVYEKISVQRERLEYQTQEEQNTALVVSVPFDHPMVSEYVFQESPPSLDCQLFRAHQSNPEDQVIQWQGPVTEWSVNGSTGRATFKIPSVWAYAFGQPCPSIKYQGPCNHILFDERCGVDEAAFISARTVSAVDGNLITLDSSPFADDACNGGEMVLASGERRMIVDNVGTLFTISTPFANISVSDAVTIKQGCDHTFTTCKAKFNNGRRFGGFPLVPNRNPFSSRL